MMMPDTHREHRRILSVVAVWWRDARGAAAAEFALVLTLLAIPILNAVDLGIYAYQRMELDNAAQVAAQAAWAIVPNCALPVTASGNCSGLTSKINTALQSTPLGTKVTVSSTTENYYCVKTSNSRLVTTGSFPTKPNPDNCASAGGLSTDTPGDYIVITASYAYTPVFPGVSVTSLLASPITRTVWMRLGST
jgi:Flp pilus assembly protein TadG